MRRFPGIIILIFVLCLPCNLNASLISLDPSFSEVTLGNQYSVDLNISGLNADESLGAYDLDIIFNPTILTFNGIVFGTGLDVLGMGWNATGATITTDGILNIYEISFDLPEDLDALQPDSFTLATLTFGTLAAGTSSLGISVNALSDSTGYLSLSSEIANGSVTVNPNAQVPVPEPATMLLLGSGLSWFAMRRKKII